MDLNWNQSAAFVGTLGFLLLALFVAAFVLRIAWAGRNDPADVDVTARLAPYTDAGGHVDVRDPQLHIVQDGEAS